MQSYARYMQAANVTGSRLLQLRPGELRQLNITLVGHQEILLAAIARLQTLHFTLNSENLQQLAMRLCSKTRCLYNELCRQPPVPPGAKQRVTVPILEAVTDAMTAVKDIIGWLNTAPFDGQDEFTEIKSRILEPSIELVINAQRDSFAVRPVDGIRAASKQLADVCDSVVQNCSDSLSLLPAPLLIMTIKRKPDEPLGLHIVRAISGVPIITGVKFQSPAHLCGKLEEGDEIVQVNYQTVVGWQLGKVIDLLQDKEFGSEVYLTVKKRPRHSNLIDQVYFKPFRLPNKKRTPYRWASSPRPDLLASLPKITLPPKLTSPAASASELTPEQPSDSDSEPFLPEPESPARSPNSVRHYLPKPRPTLQRRATVTGASPTSRRPPATIDQLWELRRDGGGGRGRLASSRSPSPGSGGSPPPPPPPPPRPETQPPAPARPLTCIGGRHSLEVRGAASDAPLWPAGGRVRSESPPAVRPPEPEPEPEPERREPGSPQLPRSSVSSLPERPTPPDKPRLEKTQSAPAYDVGRREESFERVLRELPRRPAIEEEADADAAAEWDAGSTTTNGGGSELLPGGLSAARPELSLTSGGRPEQPAAPAAAQSTASPSLPDTSTASTAVTPADAAAQHRSQGRPSSLRRSGPHETAPVTEPEVHLTAGAEPEPEPEPEPAAATERGEAETEAEERSRAEQTESNNTPPTPAVHPTVLRLSGVTEDESSSDMPGTLKDASPLREIIEKMDVAFRGLKTSLSDLSRPEMAPLTPDSTPPSQQGSARSGPAALLRQHSRLSFKGRRVSCKDLGQGDCQGWLHLKKESRGFLHGDKWAKRWMVLHGHKLYGYKDKESQQAETLVALPGYQVSPATDVRSKRHAFRVHNNERSVVFASDSQLDMTKWMNKMGLSAIAYDSARSFTTGGFSRPDKNERTGDDTYFSDTDEDENRTKSSLKRRAAAGEGVCRSGVSPSPTSSLDRARQRLRSWRSGSPAPSVGSLSSLSSLGSAERPVKKASLRFLARVRRDSGGSAASAASGRSPGTAHRRASQPETAERNREVVTVQKSTPLSESDLSRVASAAPSPVAEPSPTLASPPAAPSACQSWARRSGTPPAVPTKPASVAAAAGRHSGPGPGPVAVTARWLASPEDARRVGRPVSQPSGRAQRPVPPPRRPRSRDQPPDYVNWRVPGAAGSVPTTSGGSGRQTETVIRIGGGGRVERIEQRERRPATAGATPSGRPAESRRLSVQHRGLTPEGQLVATILSGTHTVPRPTATFRRAASADTDRPQLPGYMRPTISSRAARQGEARLRPEERRPPLSKQRSLSASGLAPALAAPVSSLPVGKRRASVASEQPLRAASENGVPSIGAATRRPPPARPRGSTQTRATPERPALASSEQRPAEGATTAAIPEETTGDSADLPVTGAAPMSATALPSAALTGRQFVEASCGPVEASHGSVEASRGPVEASHGSVEASRGPAEASEGSVEASRGSVDAGVGQSEERLLSPGSSRRGTTTTRPLSPPYDPPRLKKTSQYECPSWSPMARHAEEARMRFAFEMDLDGGGDDVFEPVTGAGVPRPRPPPRLAKSASASQVVPVPGAGRQRPSITIQVQPDNTAGGEEPRTPRKPAMGVSMIGKQRRTPTSTSPSPHFVFPAGPLSPPPVPAGAETTGISRGIAAHAASPGPLLSPPLPPLSKSQTSPALGWGLRVLPRYGLQYPPVFTPDTYSLEQMSGAAGSPSPVVGVLAEVSAAEEAADRSYTDSATQTEAARSPVTSAGDTAATLAPPPSGTGQAGRGGVHQ